MRRRRRQTLLRVAILFSFSAPVAAGTLDLSSGSLRARLQLNPWRLVFIDAFGQQVLAEAPETASEASASLGFRTTGGWLHATRVISTRWVGDALVAIAETTDPSGRRVEVTLAPYADGVIAVEARIQNGTPADVSALGIGWVAESDERFFGFGERANAVDQRGNTVENYVADGPFREDERAIVALLVPAAGFRPRDDATYFPIPWLLSSRGYGVLIENAETSYFRLGSERSDTWSLEVAGAPEGSERRPAPASLRFRVFAGPRPADVLRRFTTAVGRQPEPEAAWVFGPWFQPGGSPGEQLAQLRKLRDADAPVSVVQTYRHYLPCGSQQGQREAERQLTQAMHAAGVAITTYFNPMLCKSYEPVFSEAVMAGALTRDRVGKPYIYNYTGSTIFRVGQFDFSAPAGRGLYQRLLAEAVDDGHDGWMEDFGEYTPLDSYAADGTTGAAGHNAYPVQYHCAAYDFVSRQDRPLIRFQRSGWTGAAPCAQVVWGGDPTTDWGFDGLASALKSALNMGLSGISTWGSDVGGYFGLGERELTAELLMRWVQFGAVSGVMRTERNGFALPAKVRPQVEDNDQLPNWRRYAKLRTQLYPYLQAAAARYARSGVPIMRHLILAAPGDPQAIGRDDEFLFGPDLLAAPVLEPGAQERGLYLPAGEWIDLWRAVRYDVATGRLVLGRAGMLSGGREVRVPAPLEELPLMVRAGAVLPLLHPDVDTLADYGDPHPDLIKLRNRRNRLDLLAFPHGRSSARFYQSEQMRSIERPGRWELAIHGSRNRHYRLQASLATLRQPFVPCAVEWLGRPLPPYAWSYDAENQVLRVELRGRWGRLVVRGTCA